ncbi:unnamed protein product [Dovyalis caffra]|uniref:Uncharacterized protein n=1 Tax=Dovyalis caffra TaxID=77055 RepID=A0AAV1QZB3_9ROSI|nr:unnamed protein product [Dovyalis caffra]
MREFCFIVWPEGACGGDSGVYQTLNDCDNSIRIHVTFLYLHKMPPIRGKRPLDPPCRDRCEISLVRVPPTMESNSTGDREEWVV